MSSSTAIRRRSTAVTLESRLADRIHEMSHGGLKPEAVRTLELLAKDLDGGDRVTSRKRAAQSDRPQGRSGWHKSRATRGLARKFILPATQNRGCPCRGA